MSNFGQRGPVGGGGVRSRRDEPPRGGAHGGGGSSANSTVTDQWPDYLKSGYFDSEGHLFPELVRAEKIEPLARAMCEAGLTTGQLRRFFQHCRGLETQIKSGAASWSQVRSKVDFLAAAAADAYGKIPPKIPSLFYSFIRRNVDCVKNETDFLLGFLAHFEALVGFASLSIKKERN